MLRVSIKHSQNIKSANLDCKPFGACTYLNNATTTIHNIIKSMSNASAQNVTSSILSKIKSHQNTQNLTRSISSKFKSHQATRMRLINIQIQSKHSESHTQLFMVDCSHVTSLCACKAVIRPSEAPDKKQTPTNTLNAEIAAKNQLLKTHFHDRTLRLH